VSQYCCQRACARAPAVPPSCRLLLSTSTVEHFTVPYSTGTGEYSSVFWSTLAPAPAVRLRAASARRAPARTRQRCRRRGASLRRCSAAFETDAAAQCDVTSRRRRRDVVFVGGGRGRLSYGVRLWPCSADPQPPCHVALSGRAEPIRLKCSTAHRRPRAPNHSLAVRRGNRRDSPSKPLLASPSKPLLASPSKPLLASPSKTLLGPATRSVSHRRVQLVAIARTASGAAGRKQGRAATLSRGSQSLSECYARAGGRAGGRTTNCKDFEQAAIPDTAATRQQTRATDCNRPL
jgi:hypothetical protein